MSFLDVLRTQKVQNVVLSGPALVFGQAKIEGVYSVFNRASRRTVVQAPQRIIETCLYVEDLPRARQFYSEVVGLELHSELPERHLFFRCGEGMLLLFNADRTDDEDATLPRHGTRSNSHIAFAVSDEEVANWRDHLAKHEIEIEKEHTWPSGSLSLYFRDPSGNSLEITTPKTWGL